MDSLISQQEQQVTAREYDQWLSRYSLSACWIRFWFAPERTLWLNTQLPRLPGAIAMKAADRVLDIGCGYGGLLIYLQRKIRGKNWTIPLEGIDSSPQMIQRAGREIRRRGLDQVIHVRQGLATQLAFESNSFDVVISAYVIKHLSDGSFRKMLQEVRRVLRPGGRICLWEAGPSRFGFMNVWNLKLLKSGVSVIHLRSADEIRRIMEEEGFEIQKPFGPGFYYYYPPLPRVGFIASKQEVL